MILLLDNYDSFVYNLDRYLRRLGHDTLVFRSDSISIEHISRMQPCAIVISPGPKTPDEAGCSMEVVRRFEGQIPILGVCLGHQAIAQALGGKVVRGSSPVHGKSSMIHHQGGRLFDSIPSRFEVGRYHSLVVEPNSLPSELTATAWTDEGTVMAIEHRNSPLFGVQFHPESILTQYGYRILANFLQAGGLPCGPIPDSDLVSQHSFHS